MSSEPLISVIMPVYNGARYIEQAVRSVLAQSWSNWELLIVDDGSTDGTAAYLSSINDPRVHVLRQRNLGVSAARNAAMEMSRGEFVAFLDSDDCLPNTSLEIRARYLQSCDEFDLVCGSMSYRDNNLARELFQFVPCRKHDLLRSALRLDWHTVKFLPQLYRKVLIRGITFRDGMTHCEDILFFIELVCRNSVRIGTIEDVVYDYRVRPDSATSDFRQLDHGYHQLIWEIRQFPNVTPLDIVYLRAKIAWNRGLYWTAGVLSEGQRSDPPRSLPPQEEKAGGGQAIGNAARPHEQCDKRRLTTAARFLFGGVSTQQYRLRDGLLKVIGGLGGRRVLRYLRIANREVVVLTFHRITDEQNTLWPPMPVRVFEQLMGFLSRETVVVPLECLTSRMDYPDKPMVCLTFDDGYVDFFDHALPIIRHYRLPVTHNICPGLIDSSGVAWTQVISCYLRRNAGQSMRLPDGEVFAIPNPVVEKDFLAVLARLYTIDHIQRNAFVSRLHEDLGHGLKNRLMNWDQIRACRDAGVRIGSHGMWHSHLTTIADDCILQEEIGRSRQRIEEELGEAPGVFAVPSGFYDARCLELVREHGYRIALLCEDQSYRLPQVGSEPLLKIPRVNIANRSLAEESLRVLGLHQRVIGLIQ